MTQLRTHDHLTRFLLAQAGIRGVHVRLTDTWRQIRGRADVPESVSALLGEAVAAAALFTGHAKIDGRLSIQFRGEGALRTLFAECTAAGTLRGIARLADGADAPKPGTALRALGEGALLAITIENPGARGQEPARYQGLVGLDADTLSVAFQDYFRQSEQLPTRILLAADEDGVAGLMLQKLPGDEGDADGWDRANALFDTLGTGELLTTPADTLLHRLFHEESAHTVGGKSLRFACSCSRERVSAMLESLGEEEAVAAATGNDGIAEIRCEFCGETYRYPEGEIRDLFRTRPWQAAGSDRIQ